MTRGVTETVRLLLVEDDESQADLAATFLEREDDAFDVTTRHDAEAALSHLEEANVDCVVSDHDMPGRNGLELLEAVREREPDLPFVLFTGKGSEEIASDAISAGVTDYLQKESGSDQYAVLANRVRNAVEKRRSQRALREEKHLLEQVLATTPGSVVFTPDGDVVSATERAAATLALDTDGHDPDGRPQEPDWTFTTLDGDPLPADEHPARRVARSGERLHGERLAVEWPDGWRKYLILHCAPVFGDDGDVERVVASFTDITDRVERERVLERSQTVTQAIGDAVYTLDADGTFTFVNEAFEALAGRDSDDLVGEHCSVLLDDDSLARAEATIRDLLESDRDSGIVELELEGEDGTRHVETHIALLPFDVEFRGTAGVVRDVTDRKRRERRLRESEEKYATVVEEASDAVIIAQDGELRFGNPRAAEILDTTTADLVGTPVADVVAPEHRQTVLDRLQRRLAGEDPERRYEFDALTADGDRVPVEFTAASITYEGAPAVLAICRDVSERRRRDRELRQYETIVRTAPDGVFIVDEDANYVGGNIQGAALTGLSRSELEDSSVPDLVDEGVFDPEVVPRYLETVRDLLSGDVEDAKSKFEFRVYPPNADEPRFLECHLALRPYDDEFRGTIGVLRDVTERRRRERELERQNERLAEFASVVSHDLKSPLNVATGWLDQYRERGDEEALDRVDGALDRMSEILDELLSIAHEGEDAHDPEPVPLEAVAAAAWSSVDTGDAHLGIDASGARVEAARGRLQELFENLFTNAVEHGSASPDEAASEDADDVTVRVGTTEDGFFVADDGPGIDDEWRADVFEMGYSTTEDGTGFGLAIVDQIASTHGWTVDLTESEDGGARFEFDTDGD